MSIAVELDPVAEAERLGPLPPGPRRRSRPRRPTPGRIHAGAALRRLLPPLRPAGARRCRDRPAHLRPRPGGTRAPRRRRRVDAPGRRLQRLVVLPAACRHSRRDLPRRARPAARRVVRRADGRHEESATASCCRGDAASRPTFPTPAGCGSPLSVPTRRSTMRPSHALRSYLPPTCGSSAAGTPSGCAAPTPTMSSSTGSSCPNAAPSASASITRPGDATKARSIGARPCSSSPHTFLPSPSVSPATHSTRPPRLAFDRTPFRVSRGVARPLASSKTRSAEPRERCAPASVPVRPHQ